MTSASYFAAAFSGSTRIPGQDGPQRKTVAEARSDCRTLRGWDFRLRVMDGSEICLCVDDSGETAAVIDADGGIWRPSDEAQHQIDLAAYPGNEAIRICVEEPMRGGWAQ